MSTVSPSRALDEGEFGPEDRIDGVVDHIASSRRQSDEGGTTVVRVGVAAQEASLLESVEALGEVA